MIATSFRTVLISSASVLLSTAGLQPDAASEEPMPPVSDGLWNDVVKTARELDSVVTARPQAVLDALEKRARSVLARLEHPTDVDSWKEATPRLRRRLTASLGIERLPDPRPRRLRVVGVITRGDHVVEKLVYETFPGTSVPAHLYRPATVSGKLPAVLFVPGHWWVDSKSRSSFQAFCINLARLGFVVLTYDPIGQGERGVSFREHRRTCALLAGISQQGIVVFESRCALEYLRSRPDVDRNRIGITGASGGGYNTWMMTALDPRIAAAVPVVGTSEFFEQLHVCRPLDWYRAKEHCHFVPGLLTYANNHELLALAAPRPVLVISAAGDQSFPLPGIRQVVAHGERLYAAVSERERFAYFEDHSTGHGYQKAKREAAYGWFLRWLKGEGDGKPVPEPPTETPGHDSSELACFAGEVERSAGPGIVAHVRDRLDAGPKPSLPPRREVLQRTVRDVLGVDSVAATAELRRGSSTRVGPLTVERLSWEASDGVVIPATLIAPAGRWQGALLTSADAGRDSMLTHGVVRAAVEAGLGVVVADVRGTGELSVKETGWVFAVSLLLGENFVSRQALDLIAGRAALESIEELRRQPVGVLGCGPVASLAALYAAVLDEEFAWLVSEGGFVTFRSCVDRPSSLKQSYRLVASRDQAWTGLDREIPHTLPVFDVLRHFDIADLLAAVTPRPVLVVRPIDGDWRELSPAGISKRLDGERFDRKASASVASGATADRTTIDFVRARADR